MKNVSRLFSVIHCVMSFMFACAALLLIAISGVEVWHAVANSFDATTAQAVIEAIGLLAAAVVALQIAETILEEEVVRDADVSAPTRVRRFVSRFFVVVIVALAIEGLVAAFKAIHEDMTQLLYAAALLVSVGVLLAAWGYFIRKNGYAEKLEPEAMEEAKSEDEKLKH